MERKIMSAGKSSLVVSLPKEWMQLNELKKGDIVSYNIQRDRSLVIYPSTLKKTTPKEITLSVGQNEEEILITQKILGAFLNGYSGIMLTFRQHLHGTSNKSHPQHGWQTVHASYGSRL